jgi:hypothetical protein
VSIRGSLLLGYGSGCDSPAAAHPPTGDV